jgi:hypothetical protein
VANRDASLSANDLFNSATLGFPSVSSSITSHATTTAFLGNVEGSLSITPVPGVLLRGFLGLDYDSQLPGITTPTFAGSVNATPAGPGAKLKILRRDQLLFRRRRGGPLLSLGISVAESNRWR